VVKRYAPDTALPFEETVMQYRVLLLLFCAMSIHAEESGEFATLQARGAAAMGVDQYTSTHRFDDLADGGRIELQRNTDDAEDIATIRAHLKAIAAAFSAGDFSTPAFVHLRDMPGTATMRERRGKLQYVYKDLPRGAELRIVTQDTAALAAVHEFMAAQRLDHRAGGHH
jgi:hypothetical protein